MCPTLFYLLCTSLFDHQLNLVECWKENFKTKMTHFKLFIWHSIVPNLVLLTMKILFLSSNKCNINAVKRGRYVITRTHFTSLYNTQLWPTLFYLSWTSHFSINWMWDDRLKRGHFVIMRTHFTSLYKAQLCPTLFYLSWTSHFSIDWMWDDSLKRGRYVIMRTHFTSLYDTQVCPTLFYLSWTSHFDHWLNVRWWL